MDNAIGSNDRLLSAAKSGDRNVVKDLLGAADVNVNASLYCAITTGNELRSLRLISFKKGHHMKDCMWHPLSKRFSLGISIVREKWIVNGRECAHSRTACYGVLLGLPIETAAVLSADGWLDTGDVGWMGESGRLWLLGRSKDVIKSGGENIYASEVENALLKHPKILSVDVVVLWAPTQKRTPVTLQSRLAGNGPHRFIFYLFINPGYKILKELFEGVIYSFLKLYCGVSS